MFLTFPFSILADMKKLYLFVLLYSFFSAVHAQHHALYAGHFKEVREACTQNSSLWNKNIYSAILLVDPQTRQVFSNEPDSAGLLQPKDGIYTGILPANVNIANTATQWSGKRWAMILLPLPENKNERINLLAHELFHQAQPGLGFRAYNDESAHLDKKEGRIYLRLELEALKKAISAKSKTEQKQHLTQAFVFRKYRHFLYPKSADVENLLELNEGLAEFTGLMISARTEKENIVHLSNSINTFMGNPTYVRSFAYQTIPVYGYLLYKKQKEWNRKITDTSNLTKILMRELDIVLPKDIKAAAEKNSATYNGKQITQEEDKREEEIKKVQVAYKKQFIESPHVELGFEQMNVSFDPRNIMPLEEYGTVYPNIRVTDNWGILTVEHGALMSPMWDKITVSVPISIGEKKVTGDGWVLELNEGYSLEKNNKDGHYRLVKK